LIASLTRGATTPPTAAIIAEKVMAEYLLACPSEFGGVAAW